MAFDCDSKCNQWISSNRERCKIVRACVCNICSPLRAVNYNAYLSCRDACQTEPRPTESSDYLCDYLDHDAVFNNFGIACTGLENTSQYQIAKFESDQQFDITPYAIGGGAIMLILIILIFYKQ